mmetsp:Transcript_21825/g.43580  ORF Transcript_21825/g.43580 Transcript_21825/m.43580 type:complete len:379 (-) Transcript_21825:206-1342(-)
MVSLGSDGFRISIIIWSSSSSSGLGATTTTRASGSSRLPKFRVPRATTSGAARADSFLYSSSCATVGKTIFTLFRSELSPSSPAATGRMLSSRNCARTSGWWVSSASRTSTSILRWPASMAARIAAPAESAASVTEEGAEPKISVSSKYSYSRSIGRVPSESSPEGRSDSSRYSVSIISSSSSSSKFSRSSASFFPSLFWPRPDLLRRSMRSVNDSIVAKRSSFSLLSLRMSTCCFDVKASSCRSRRRMSSSPPLAPSLSSCAPSPSSSSSAFLLNKQVERHIEPSLKPPPSKPNPVGDIAHAHTPCRPPIEDSLRSATFTRQAPSQIPKTSSSRTVIIGASPSTWLQNPPDFSMYKPNPPNLTSTSLSCFRPSPTLS